jgi:predicted transcriptional regulator
MEKRCGNDWICQPKMIQTLVSFSVPRTPKQVEKRLDIKKLKMKPFVERGLVRLLNPEAKKGRLYTVTEKGRRLLGLPISGKEFRKRWNLAGYIMASPKQRLVVIKVMDSAKRTSEDIRARASQFNPHMTRVSTKEVLKALISRDLVHTELVDRKRYYWITQKGRSVVRDLGLAKS